MIWDFRIFIDSALESESKIIESTSSRDDNNDDDNDGDDVDDE